MEGSWRQIADAKKLQQKSKIPTAWVIPQYSCKGRKNLTDVPLTCGLLSDVERQITSDYDATDLLERIKGGIWSSEQVVTAFCKRAAIAHQLVNCLTEIFFNEAIERARQLDREREANGSAHLKPLHGLPISLKDSFQVKGYDASTGLACFVDAPVKETYSLPALLQDLGAVLYCKTNLPQTIMTGDSDNNVFGRTLNPHNTALTAGGSTGGEGALLAMRGSVLGVGTDIAGSIRVPAVCDGICGFRPSVGLVPHGAVRDITIPGTDVVRSTAGPMATSVRDCQLFLKAVMQSPTWKYDSSIISVPWIDVKIRGKLRIAVVQDDGIYTPTPPVRRGMAKAIDMLQKSGQVELIPLTLPNTSQIYDDHWKLLSLGGTKNYLELLARTGEPTVPSVAALLEMTGFQENTLQGFFELKAHRTEAEKQYHQLFVDNDIDAILMPPAPHTAVPWDTWTTATYTALWDYLDYPACVFPVDKVRELDLADNISNAKYGAADAKVYQLYTGPELYENAPICVQVVGYRQLDEALAATTVVLDSIINSN
ncbi:amidase [Xylogone sp. PMI_703]|nr:amidase [Xylogone sp. PMI_703]